ncbi:hybrid sensor histidine kinase/response regulator [Massilia sp. GCM10020059]|uniref:histidine kinase n=1 Tax=Massilia agrisoli TaxID=2892444 RepID=A0ABS8IXV1_9BURK|nr:hybrid sensor histidine kinase/response regulator [Massilia agrisoli]MCC6072738.1 hybrid sensor histidine kinase/response regulator [Massilia agrisoli]
MSQPPYGDLSQFSMLDLFRMEAEGQARTLTDGLLAMERGAVSLEAIDVLMRAAHSIKGAAAIVNLDVAVQVAHAMEDAFVAAQAGRLELTPARIDVLLSGVDLIMQFAALTDASIDSWMAQNANAVTTAIAAIAGIASVQSAPSLPPPAAAPTPPAPPAPAEAAPAPQAQQPQAPRASQNYDQLLALASESRINAHQMRPLVESLQRHKRHQSAVLQAIEQLHEAVMRSGDAALVERSSQLLHKTAPLKQFVIDHMADIEGYERRVLGVSAALVEEVLALRMRPFRDGVHAFPRMVRDLARSLGKDAQLIIEGEETLVDRDILSRIESPLNHMLRNAVDHGMETAVERMDAGKPASGTIRLEARHRAGMLNIEISDDGRGVDLDRIRANVVARGMASDAMAAAMSSAELLEFLFLPAFSLKETASAISGRGVGLDIVQQVIREQNGSVRLESQPGVGFRTSITLPLTQSIVRALVFDVQGEAYAIPIVKVERVLKVPQSGISTLENKQFFDAGGGEHLGLVPAAQVLELGQMEPGGDELAVLVIGSGQRRYALVVDAIRGEHSLAVQALDPIFGKMRDISAAALLDDGSPVLILDVADLLLSIDKLLHAGGLHKLSGAGSTERRRSRRVLVVDDSLTVREMERKLLLGRGYQVDVAIDGMDGWNAVRSGAYDLVITDVDMPRMDGVELVALIRKDIDLHKLPVMIVSYKDRPEDRARGMAAGADYYLTKGSFHDETLLDAVFDLIGDPTI